MKIVDGFLPQQQRLPILLRKAQASSARREQAKYVDGPLSAAVQGRCVVILATAYSCALMRATRRSPAR